MRCHYHAEDEAIGACAMCGHPLCQTCTVERDRVFYCASCLTEKEGTPEPGSGTEIPKIELPAGEYCKRPSRKHKEQGNTGSEKRPATAALLSIFIPFTGQIYNNQFAKALTFLLLFISCIILAEKSHPMEGLFGVIAAFIYFYQIYDAYKTARGRKETESSTALVPLLTGNGEQATHQTAAPEMEPAAASGGESPVWGISLILIGIAFLLNNFNLIHLETLVRLWPIFVVATGLVMILTYLRRSTT
jgi:hypothetical protein